MSRTRPAITSGSRWRCRDDRALDPSRESCRPAQGPYHARTGSSSEKHRCFLGQIAKALKIGATTARRLFRSREGSWIILRPIVGINGQYVMCTLPRACEHIKATLLAEGSRAICGSPPAGQAKGVSSAHLRCRETSIWSGW